MNISDLIDTQTSDSENNLCLEIREQPSGVQDPWDWSVEEVVSHLCHSDELWKERSYSINNQKDLEDVLKSNNVNGPLMLELTPEELRNDLGIVNLGDRKTIQYAIGKLRKSSVKYHTYSIEQPPMITESYLPTGNQFEVTDQQQLEFRQLTNAASSEPCPLNEQIIPTTSSTSKRRASLVPVESTAELPKRSMVAFEESNPTEWDYLLTKYPSDAIDDSVLPLYGESDLDGSGKSLDAEIEHGQQTNNSIRKASRGPLGQEEVRVIVDDIIERMVNQYLTTKIPKRASEMPTIWSKGYQNETFKRNAYAWIAHLEDRLAVLRSELLDRTWFSQKQLAEQCESCRITVNERENYKWTLQICALPVKPPIVTPSASNKQKRNVRTPARRGDEGDEESLDSDSDGSEDSSHDNDASISSIAPAKPMPKLQKIVPDKSRSINETRNLIFRSLQSGGALSSPRGTQELIETSSQPKRSIYHAQPLMASLEDIRKWDLPALHTKGDGERIVVKLVKDVYDDTLRQEARAFFEARTKEELRWMIFGKAPASSSNIQIGFKKFWHCFINGSYHPWQHTLPLDTCEKSKGHLFDDFYTFMKGVFDSMVSNNRLTDVDVISQGNVSEDLTQHTNRPENTDEEGNGDIEGLLPQIDSTMQRVNNVDDEATPRVQPIVALHEPLEISCQYVDPANLMIIK